MTSIGTTFIEDRKIKILKKIIDKTGAKIVLSSTWRYGWKHIELGLKNTELAKDFIELKNKFEEYELEIYDKTIILDRFMRRRGDEIKTYLDNHDNIEGYVIIDDLGGKWLRPCSSHLLQTNEFKGLEEKHIRVAERILNSGI